MTMRKTNPLPRGSWSVKHGHTRDRNESPTFSSWRGMKERCKPTGDYGKMGIKVCPRWAVFDNFLSDMGERPVGCEIDRKDPLGGYEKSNCRWTEKRTNRQHRRTTRLTEAKREEITRLRQSGWTYRRIAESMGVSISCISDYLNGNAWATPRPPS